MGVAAPETALYAVGSRPLRRWNVHIDPHGSVERVMDEDIRRTVIDIQGASVATTFVHCPKVGTRLPHVSFLIKCMGTDMPCSIEVEMLDSRQTRRRLRAATYQKRVTSDDKVTAMPLSLGVGWNHVQFHLDDFLQRWYGTGYVEAVGIEVHATCRVRRIYFTDASQCEDELADEFRLAVISKSCKSCM